MKGYYIYSTFSQFVQFWTAFKSSHWSNTVMEWCSDPAIVGCQLVDMIHGVLVWNPLGTLLICTDRPSSLWWLQIFWSTKSHISKYSPVSQESTKLLIILSKYGQLLNTWFWYMFSWTNTINTLRFIFRGALNIGCQWRQIEHQQPQSQQGYSWHNSA